MFGLKLNLTLLFDAVVKPVVIEKGRTHLYFPSKY